MTITKYALHEIEQPDKLDFAPADYSLFKYGNDQIAQQFGSALAEGFIKKHLQKNYTGTQLVVISSPYSFIPTATFAMKNHFVSALNRWLVQQHFPVIEETQVHRTVTYRDDYGALNAEERMRLIGNDKFHIDRHFVKDKQLVFLDDIRITGSHERMILKMANDFGLQNDAYLLYFAELINDTIHPRFENYLNYYAVKSIFDLHDIINSSDFVANTRIVKYILNYAPADFDKFIAQQTAAFKTKLYDLAIGNGYHTIDAYTTNLQKIAPNAPSILSSAESPLRG